MESSVGRTKWRPSFMRMGRTMTKGPALVGA
jgi:hypothetical protein